MDEGGEHAIGGWLFDVRGATLHGPGGERRLEDRAARTLALLCRRRGETVPAADILSEVWNGRSVSSNSVAVVIGDLRRSLGDDARDPRHIVTVAKRGYRLAAEPRTPGDDAASIGAASRGLRRRRMIIMLAPLSIAAGAVVALRAGEPAHATIVALGPVANETGQQRFAPLALALGELVPNRLARREVTTVVALARPRRDADKPNVQLAARLILWNGEPTLSLTATEIEDGKLVWAGMAGGPDEELAKNTIARVDDFAKFVRAHRFDAPGAGSGKP